MSIRIVIADDQTLVREGLRSLLGHAEDLEVVGEAKDGIEAVFLAETLAPDVVLMDIRMPVVDGIEATKRIMANPGSGGIRVLVLTTFELDEYVFAALRAGASGFLLKDVEPNDLRAAVRVVAGGDALLSPSVTSRLISEFVSRTHVRPHASHDLEVLTEREREVLHLVGLGIDNGEIASRLFISLSTTKTHVSRVMAKLDAHDRAQLVVIAYETGLIEARPSPDCPH